MKYTKSEFRRLRERRERQARRLPVNIHQASAMAQLVAAVSTAGAIWIHAVGRALGVH